MPLALASIYQIDISDLSCTSFRFISKAYFRRRVILTCCLRAGSWGSRTQVLTSTPMLSH